VAIDHKLENGCEIQHPACGRSGIMIYLHHVTTAAYQRQQLTPAESRLLHGTVIQKPLAAKWAGTDRVVCGDSYFTSVEAALS